MYFVHTLHNKSYVQSCSDYRGIKSLRHTLKIQKRVVCQLMTLITEQQFGFIPRTSTTFVNCALAVLCTKYKGGHKQLHLKIYDGMLRY